MFTDDDDDDISTECERDNHSGCDSEDCACSCHEEE